MTAASDLPGHELMRIYAGTDTRDSNSTDFSSFQYEELENTERNRFLLKDNYARFFINVGENQSLVLVSDSQSTSGQAVWSSIQITELPPHPIIVEPPVVSKQIPMVRTLILILLTLLLILIGFKSQFKNIPKS